jgi:hypothetical protein
VDQFEVGILVLLVRRLVLDEVGLERRHAILAEERRDRPRPEIPEPVGVVAGRLRPLQKVATHDAVERVEQLAARKLLPVNRELERVALFVNGHAAVEDERLIAAQPRRAVAHDRRHVLPQTRA